MATKANGKITRQKVNAVLKKAGFSRAEYRRSGQVRGWGHWSKGYRVTEGIYGLSVDHETGGHHPDSAEMMGPLERYRDALVAAGIEARIVGHRINIGPAGGDS